MKRLPYLILCILVLVLLIGCTNYTGITREVNNLTKNTTSQSDQKTNWEPTTFNTINNFAGVTMNVEKETISPNGLTIKFQNNSDIQCIYGEYFFLEKKINKDWHQVPITVKGEYGFNDIGYNLAFGYVNEWTVDWEWLYGTLDTGEYRIIKEISDFRETGDYDTYHLAAEFMIK